VVLAVSGCGLGGPSEVAVRIDGGTDGVALLGDVVVAAGAGDTVTVHHATTLVSGAEAPTTHALVAAGADALPPIFGAGAGGIIPNPAVWGPCGGGTADEAVGQCPVPAVEGPTAWDGRSYWSLGAMLPGEQRELVLSDDIADGDHVLVCALHPQLRLVVRVGGDAEESATPSAGQRSDAAREQAVAVADSGARPIVLAGVDVEEQAAFVSVFAPETVRVAVGDSVTWRAGARTPVDVVFGAGGADQGELSLSHTAPEDGLPSGDASGWDGRGELRSGFLSADPAAGASGAEWTVTFTQPGTFTYASRFSDLMTGTVVVEEDTR
jgi:plastocyanin